MKIALVDDDQNCLEEMAGLCRNFGVQNRCQIEVTLFSCGEDYLTAQKEVGFDLVFMDVFMEGMDGVDAALKMRESDIGCILVFLTSSTEFMPEAFSCHAFEYVIKPFSPRRIAEVLEDALKVLPSVQKYMEVSIGRTTVPVSLNQIISVVTDAHYLDITLADGTALRSRMTMSMFMELAGQDDRLIPVNKGITVNADYILDFTGNCCILENGMHFPVRIRDRLRIEQLARDYHFNKIRRRQTADRHCDTGKA